MISRLLNSESKTITGAAIMIAAATLISRCVGIARDRVFAHFFGAGATMDAYYAAFKIPDLIYNLLIVGALTAGFIPTFTKLFYNDKNKTAAWQLTNNIINIVGITLAVICGIGIIFTPALSKIIAPGFVGQKQKMVIEFTRIMFLSPFFLGISMVVGGVLQSLKQFVLYSIAPIFYNIGIILGATLFIHSPRLGISGLAWGVVLGAALHATIQIYGAYMSGYRWHWRLTIHDINTRVIGKLMIPRTMGLAVTQLNAVIVTMLASFLPAGSITVYNLANNLQAVPIGIIGIPFALAVFPTLATMAAQNNREGLIEHLAVTTRQILFLIIPLSIAILLLRAQMVRVVYGTGAFDWQATITTANALAFFALGLLAQSLIPLYARAFYAQSNTKTPFTIGVIAELVSIIAALLLIRPLGIAGLALAGSIGATLNISMLIIALRKINGNLKEEKTLQMLFRCIIAALAMGLVVQFLKYPLARALNLNRFWGILLQGLISGTIGLFIYGIICYFLKVEEMIHLEASLKRRWLRLWNVPAGIDEAERL